MLFNQNKECFRPQPNKYITVKAHRCLYWVFCKIRNFVSSVYFHLSTLNKIQKNSTRKILWNLEGMRETSNETVERTTWERKNTYQKTPKHNHEECQKKQGQDMRYNEHHFWDLDGLWHQWLYVELTVCCCSLIILLILW